MFPSTTLQVVSAVHLTGVHSMARHTYPVASEGLHGKGGLPPSRRRETPWVGQAVGCPRLCIARPTALPLPRHDHSLKRLGCPWGGWFRVDSGWLQPGVRTVSARTSTRLSCCRTPYDSKSRGPSNTASRLAWRATQTPSRKLQRASGPGYVQTCTRWKVVLNLNGIVCIPLSRLN